MTTTELHRLNNQQLAEIGRRLATPLTDEGYRAWYRADVNALAEEVIILRRDRAAAMTTFAASPPLEGIDQNTDLAEVAQRMAVLWIEQQQGVWQKAEVKRIREKLADTEQRLQAAERGGSEMSAHIAVLDERIEQQKAEVAQIDSERHQAHAETAKAVSDHSQREAALRRELEQVQANLRATVEEARRAVDAVHAMYTERGLRAAALLSEVNTILVE